MNKGDESNFDAQGEPQPLDYRAPRDDRARANAELPAPKAIMIFCGLFIGLGILPAAICSGLAARVGIEPVALSLSVIVITTLCWKPVRYFGVGLLIGIGILGLLFGACVFIFSRRI